MVKKKSKQSTEKKKKLCVITCDKEANDDDNNDNITLIKSRRNEKEDDAGSFDTNNNTGRNKKEEDRLSVVRQELKKRRRSEEGESDAGEETHANQQIGADTLHHAEENLTSGNNRICQSVATSSDKIINKIISEKKTESKEWENYATSSEYSDINDEDINDDDNELYSDHAEALTHNMEDVTLTSRVNLADKSNIANTDEMEDEDDDDDEDDSNDKSNLIVWRRDQDENINGRGENDSHDNMEHTLEKLTYSNKAYDSFFQLRTEYPCLSFDVICDNETVRNHNVAHLNTNSNNALTKSTYPLSMTLICGTQADEVNKNELIVLHVSNICRTKHDVESDEDSDDSYIGDEGESDDDLLEERGEGKSNGKGNTESDIELNDGEPFIHHRTISHYGTANRVRCCHTNTNLTTTASPHYAQLVAVWSDAGHVQIFDLDDNVRALTDFANWSKEKAQMQNSKNNNKSNLPETKYVGLKFCTPSSSHRTEGYGVDWSTIKYGVFASGDCNGELYLWQPTDDGRWTNFGSNTASFASNTLSSIEEIQWSPTQSEVLITARVGGLVEVWDARDMRQSKLHWSADVSDINVADWNNARQASHLLVTGAESGTVAVWDLRKLSTATPIQRLEWHTKSITSVEFSSHNESVLLVTCDDGQCTLWDLSLERDVTEEQEAVGTLFGRPDLINIPDQLMFQHQGLVHPKEGHWHPDIPGMMITTDYHGLHLFRPMNWRSLMK